MLPTIPSGNVASATAPTTFSIANSCRFNDDDDAYMAHQLRCFCGACWEGLEDRDPEDVARIMAKGAPCALSEYRASQDRLAREQELATRAGHPIW